MARRPRKTKIEETSMFGEAQEDLSSERLMSLETEQWVAMRKAADCVANQVLAKAYRRLGIAHRAGEHGVSITAYSREHILAHSDGAKSVAANLERAGVQASPDNNQRANFEERQSKRMFPLASFKEMWRARSAERGFPVFEQSDKRLEVGFELSAAMTPGQAVDAGLQLAAKRGERVFDERKLLEVSIKASGFATPHLEIREEIGRQLLSQELVLHRGAIVRPAPGQELDAGQAMPIEPKVAPLLALDASQQLVDAARLPAGPERDAVLSLAAGDSPRTIVPTSPSCQPAALAAIAASAAASGRELHELHPITHASAGQRTIEAALAARGALVNKPSVLVVHHSDELSARTLSAVRNRAAACDARLVEMHDAGRLREPLPIRQVNERSLEAQAKPVERLHRDSKVSASPDAANQAAASRAAERLANGERSMVVTTSQASAAALNERITSSLAASTGEPVKKIRVRKPKPVESAGVKLAGSYAVGETVMVKRRTGSLRRREIAVIDAINARAGFLTLRVGEGADARRVVISLDTQAHHIERVEVQEVSVTAGALLRVEEDLPSLGLAAGQAVQCELVEEGKLRLRGHSGSEHEVSTAAGPIPLSPAMAAVAADLSDADLAAARVARPEVLVALGADADQADIAAAMRAGGALDGDAIVHAPQDLLDRHPLAPSLDPSRQGGFERRVGRLVVHESDLAAMSALRDQLSGQSIPESLEAARVTIITKSGARQLHTLRDKASRGVLSAELGRVLGHKPTAPAKEATKGPSQSRPSGPDRSR